MSDLRLYNTLSRRIETFQPLQAGQVRMYCCGPTVYNFIHIGNLRTFLWGDLLRRYLEWKGFGVNMVMNLTDVEDKIIRSASAKGVDIYTYCAPYIDAFFEDIDTLRIRRADLYPKATDHIPEMVALVEKLSEKGHTYVSDGSTYFNIATLPGYGRLAQLDLQQADSSVSRIESDEYEKENARDFVLWKARKGSEVSWPASIGEGRPGWHLECSAMAMKYLGESFDIHTGAVDLIFPHHENEIAQSEGATDVPYVKYWIHGEHLNVDQQKMSKSVGNIFTLRELLKDYTPLQIRYALLSVPHRTKLNFTLRSLDDAKSALERLDSFRLRLSEPASGEEPSARGQHLSETLLRDFEASMDDDLNTAGALGALFSTIREANTAMDDGVLTAADRSSLAAALERIDQVLDILPREERVLDAEIEKLIEARGAARKARDFAESDRLRDQLLGMGIVLEDTPAGMRWRRK